MLTAQRKKDAIKDLKELHGIPSMGFCAGDGYFANSLVAKYGMSISELEKED